MEESHTPIQFNISKHLNQRMLLLGLEGMQLLILGLILLISYLIHWVLPILIIIPVIFSVRYIVKETKGGNPTPINSFLLKYKIKKKVIDTDCVLFSISKEA
jgi:hypothetical protein